MRSKFKNLYLLLTVGVIIGIVACLIVFIPKEFKGDKAKIMKTAQILKEKMEEKYGIKIIESKGFYNRDHVGYGATLTTKNGITFDAWNQPHRIVDFYQEEVLRKKGIEKWGYANEYLTNVEKIDLNIGFRNEQLKEIEQLTDRIENVKNKLWLTLYIDLNETFKKEKAKEVEHDIFNYYQKILNDQGEGIELIVRHKNDTGSYMIIKDENGELPPIEDVSSIARTLDKF
ncbi:hypothetical protein ACSBO6_08665 [Bacillus sp. AL-1R]